MVPRALVNAPDFQASRTAKKAFWEAYPTATAYIRLATAVLMGGRSLFTSSWSLMSYGLGRVPGSIRKCVYVCVHARVRSVWSPFSF